MTEDSLERGKVIMQEIQYLEDKIHSAELFIEPHERGGVYGIVHTCRSEWDYKPEVTLKDIKDLILNDIKKKQTKLKKLQDEFENL